MREIGKGVKMHKFVAIDIEWHVNPNICTISYIFNFKNKMSQWLPKSRGLFNGPSRAYSI